MRNKGGENGQKKMGRWGGNPGLIPVEAEVKLRLKRGRKEAK